MNKDKFTVISVFGMWVSILMIMAGALGGCSAERPLPIPDQARAEQVVWRDVFGETEDPPTIYWRNDCEGPSGEAGLLYSGECVGGVFYVGHYAAEVAWPGSFHASAFAHELMHASQFIRGVYDASHEVAEDWGRVYTANAALAAEGL
jgi:hypothetical protein